MQKDLKKDKKVSKDKQQKVDDVNGVQPTLDKMLDSSMKHTESTNCVAVPGGDTAEGLEDDDMLSVIKRRRQLAAKSAEEKKKRDAEEKIL